MSVAVVINLDVAEEHFFLKLILITLATWKVSRVGSTGQRCAALPRTQVSASRRSLSFLNLASGSRDISFPARPCLRVSKPSHARTFGSLTVDQSIRQVERDQRPTGCKHPDITYGPRKKADMQSQIWKSPGRAGQSSHRGPRCLKDPKRGETRMSQVRSPHPLTPCYGSLSCERLASTSLAV